MTDKFLLYIENYKYGFINGFEIDFEPTEVNVLGVNPLEPRWLLKSNHYDITITTKDNHKFELSAKGYWVFGKILFIELEDEI